MLYALCALSGLGWRAAAGIGAVVALIDALGRPSQVAALNRLLSPLEVAAPVLLGLVADRIGLAAALALLALQPVTVLAVALRSKGAERGR